MALPQAVKLAGLGSKLTAGFRSSPRLPLFLDQSFMAISKVLEHKLNFIDTLKTTACILYVNTPLAKAIGKIHHQQGRGIYPLCGGSSCRSNGKENGHGRCGKLGMMIPGTRATLKYYHCVCHFSRWQRHDDGCGLELMNNACRKHFKGKCWGFFIQKAKYHFLTQTES